MSCTRGFRRIRPGAALACLSLLGALVISPSVAPAAEYAFFNVGAGISAVDTGDFLPVGTIPLPGTSLWGMTTCAQAQRLYAFDINTQTVNVVDPGLGRVVGSIPLPGLRFTPYGMAVNAECTRLYFAADKWQNGLIAIDLTQGLVMREVDIPYAHHVAVSPSGEKIYVTTRYGELYVLRASDFEVLSYGLHQGAELAINAAGTRVYLAGDRGNVAVLDTATDTLIGTLPAPFTWISSRFRPLGVRRQQGARTAGDHRPRRRPRGEGDHAGGRPVGPRRRHRRDRGRLPGRRPVRQRFEVQVRGGRRRQPDPAERHTGATRALLCNSRFIMAVQTPETHFTVNSTVDAVTQTRATVTARPGSATGSARCGRPSRRPTPPRARASSTSPPGPTR